MAAGEPERERPDKVAVKRPSATICRAMQKVNFDLTGKVALLTGSGRGIGLGMARALAAHGAAVAIQDIEKEVAEAAAAAIRAGGGKAMALGGDVTDLATVEGFIPQVVEQLGGLHILINNAAIQIARKWTELTHEEMLAQWRANMAAPMILCQRATPIFRAQKWGRVLNLGSIQQKGGMAGMLAYSMSKAAMENMTKALAKDLAPDGVTVNLLAPGFFNTYRNREHFEGTARADAGKWVPLGRHGEPEDCAGVTVMLCSDAGSYITGQSIYVDGGMSAR